ncbi:hypothetical protein CEUSTIGMA_g3125.t1 [Chlamydomonas eustigma]|uniref:Protein-serine/threonine kinase n=1 Tax=Chlamydomonas eustigma TaxID=1157962 RepID=A0A250WYJ8_9CHLO|nr:hypothetical protein CEUSTIGMA_g3125.t1 [Chlamydomonas eustigma]|eukprot:GAX75682.1 hypothetical protein CEUSTIGMA_g3125.t1 [Chlamydomonas eustigma]
MNLSHAKCVTFVKMRLQAAHLPICENLRYFSSLHRATTNFYDSTIEKWAQQRLETISLSQLITFGREAVNEPEKILKSARYVQRELPMRLARRLLDLQLLPYIVVTNPHIRTVYDGYQQAFDVLRSFPTVRTHEDNAAFCALLRKQLETHNAMLDLLAAGLRECMSKRLVGSCLQLDSFFDSMLRSRISRRILAEQHLHLGDRRPGYVGIICMDLNIREAAEFSAQKTRQVCTETYGVAPELVVSGHASMPHVPAHLDYILFELMKNAARAVVEKHYVSFSSGGAHAANMLPSIAVKICDGSQDMTIRVSDQGGGIPLTLLNQVWSYGFSTVGMDQGSLDRLAAERGATATSSGMEGSDDDPISGAVSVERSYTRMASNDVESITGGEELEMSMSLSQGSGSSDSGKFVPSYKPFWRESAGGLATELDAVTLPLKCGMIDPCGVDKTREMPSARLPAVEGISSAQTGSTIKMAGLGFGLPLSRLYARYFGGSLDLKVLPGYGTDAYITLRRLEGSVLGT